MPTILAFQSNLADLDKLQLDKELREISLSLAPVSRKHFQIVNLGAVQINDISRYLMEYEPEIFHFAGHGNEKGELIFQDADGRPRPMNQEAMELIFSKLGRKVKCVVLSACFSKKQAQSLARFVPYVVCNTKAIADHHAIIFSSNFYAGLSYGYTVEESFELATVVLSATDSSYTRTPKLFAPAKSTGKKLFAQPEVMARFILDKNQRPRKVGEEYKMELWIENLPRTVISVVYNYNHNTVKRSIEELQNDGLGAKTDFSLYGNIKLRITLWYLNEGVGMVSWLFDALQNYYRSKKLSLPIKKALEQIRDY